MTNRKDFYSTSEVDSSSDELLSIEISSEEYVIDAECTARYLNASVHGDDKQSSSVGKFHLFQISP